MMCPSQSTDTDIQQVLQVGDKLLTFDLFEECFLCDYDRCRGVCCVDGDNGAPLMEGEAEIIRSLLPKLEPLLSPAAHAILLEQGVSYRDESGEEVTSLVEGRDCVFTTYDGHGRCQCAIERLYHQGESDFIKPLSCHLYPIRVKKYAEFIALNYDRWDICHAAVKLGRKRRLPLYISLREPLVRAFGAAWYDELCQAATLYETEYNTNNE